MMTPVQRDLPSGTVTFFFTDVEGSTKLLRELGTKGYAEALAEHRRVIREACARHNGVEVDTQGDAFFVAFPTAPGALAAAGEITEALATGSIQVRIGLHTGTPLLTEEGYVGGDVHRAARIAAAGHGGQVLVSASTAPLVELELRDLGEHRFKDLGAPERVYQAGGGTFPALKSLYRTNLPVPATPFLGRERELAEVVELLTRDDLRLLTLTGPGGTGKTRLALQAAAEASESFPDGIYWVPLAPLRDPSLVLSSLAQTLAVSEEPTRPLQDTLGAHLAGKRMLLLLDNLEHLLPQVAAPIAALRDANGSSLLVTSRERLRIGGEQTWPVPPLADEDGTALFVARARAVEPSFAPTPAVDELCARLDELPLAIELAAARTAVFSSEQLLERLSGRLDLLKGDRDADPRQQTLRATIAWSHDLLAEEEQQLFRRLSVFVGGCTYQAAEEVADADPDTLQSLLDKSLLRKRDTAQEPRYWMLETIREYAGEWLEESGEAVQLRERHIAWVLALAREAKSHSMSAEWLDRLEEERANLRAALEQARSLAPGALTALPALLWLYWAKRDHLIEGQTWLEAALSRCEPESSSEREQLLAGASWMAFYRGDLVTASERGEERLVVARSLGDIGAVAGSLGLLGSVAGELGEFERSVELSEEAVAIRRAHPETSGSLAITLHNLGVAWEQAGNGPRAAEAAAEALALCRAAHDSDGMADAYVSLGAAALLDGNDDEAHECVLAGVRLAGSDRVAYWGLHRALLLLAVIDTRAEQWARAARLLAAVEGAGEATGAVLPSQDQRKFDDARATVAAQLDPQEFMSAWNEGRAMDIERAATYALESRD